MSRAWDKKGYRPSYRHVIDGGGDGETKPDLGSSEKAVIDLSEEPEKRSRRIKMAAEKDVSMSSLGGSVDSKKNDDGEEKSKGETPGYGSSWEATKDAPSDDVTHETDLKQEAEDEADGDEGHGDGEDAEF
ncbi:hypothetical protein L1987_43310 [Smallanthus sonchifolius]|uniref:Uncharacterized protein n=1 Tax=Smallanthus sonchifolius TaxID=185202 RepID=A0ACB9GL77_9ASTR|nr:hypothetical protein L1987_43310 [Smallanthus sonchifolius]